MRLRPPCCSEAALSGLALVICLAHFRVDAWLYPTITRITSSSKTAPSMAQEKRATRASGTSWLMAAGTNDDKDPDLFDYFDPLLSPHAYPNGISPENKPSPINESIPLPVMDDEPAKFRAQPEPLASPQRPSVETSPGTMHAQFLERQKQMQSSMMNDKGDGRPTEANGNGEKEKDLFDYFDPLLSPHAYPNGISPNEKLQTSKTEQPSESSWAVPSPRPLETIPSSSPSSSSSRVGILLMDHGSRNPASNDRLVDLARLYQQTLALDGSDVVVEAAHMEIATPTIPDGLQALLDQGVDEIVCHPYFLSPGRHVREDIPQIVESAIADMNIEIPVRTTDPVGSNTQLMIGAIHSLVRETSVMLREK